MADETTQASERPQGGQLALHPASKITLASAGAAVLGAVGGRASDLQPEQIAQALAVVGAFLGQQGAMGAVMLGSFVVGGLVRHFLTREDKIRTQYDLRVQAEIERAFGMLNVQVRTLKALERILARLDGVEDDDDSGEGEPETEIEP